MTREELQALEVAVRIIAISLGKKEKDRIREILKEYDEWVYSVRSEYTDEAVIDRIQLQDQVRRLLTGKGFDTTD